MSESLKWFYFRKLDKKLSSFLLLPPACLKMRLVSAHRCTVLYPKLIMSLWFYQRFELHLNTPVKILESMMWLLSSQCYFFINWRIFSCVVDDSIFTYICSQLLILVQLLGQRSIKETIGEGDAFWKLFLTFRICSEQIYFAQI